MRPSVSRTLRLKRIDTLSERAGVHQGELRRVLETKIAALRADVAVEGRAEGNDVSPSAPLSIRGPLGSMADALAPRSPSYPELAALDAFQKTWSRKRTESQLRESLDHAPENAGPLNSSALVQRSIALMRDLSPGYLHHFVSYVDDLSSLELLSGVGAGAGAGASAGRDVPQAATIGKRPRAKAKARSRRE